jgi:hypothetical protein
MGFNKVQNGHTKYLAVSKKTAIEATENGLPALAGVEPLIVAELQERCHRHYGGTLNAVIS